MSRIQNSGFPFGQARTLNLPGVWRTVVSGTITVTAGNASNTGTIAAVDLANTRTRWIGQQGSTTNGGCYVRVEQTNATTITGTRTTTTFDATVGYVVEQFWPGYLRSVQRGTLTILAGATSGTATIAAVNTTLSDVNYGGYSGGDADVQTIRMDLTNATTVTAVISSLVGTDLIVAFDVGYR